MKNKDSKIIGWLKSSCSSRFGTSLSIVFIILLCGSHGNSWGLSVMAGADYQVISLQCRYSAILDGMNNALVNVIICSLILILALTGTFLVHAWNMIRALKEEIEKLKRHELINNSGGNN